MTSKEDKIAIQVLKNETTSFLESYKDIMSDSDKRAFEMIIKQINLTINDSSANVNALGRIVGALEGRVKNLKGED